MALKWDRFFTFLSPRAESLRGVQLGSFSHWILLYLQTLFSGKHVCLINTINLLCTVLLALFPWHALWGESRMFPVPIIMGHKATSELLLQAQMSNCSTSLPLLPMTCSRVNNWVTADPVSINRVFTQLPARCQHLLCLRRELHV